MDVPDRLRLIAWQSTDRSVSPIPPALAAAAPRLAASGSLANSSTVRNAGRVVVPESALAKLM